MKSLIIKSQNEKPHIWFNTETNVFEIDGDFYSTQTSEMGQSLNSWLEKYLTKNTSPISLNIKCCHYPSSSYDSLIHVLTLFRDFYTQSKGFVMVNWFVNFSDARIIDQIKSFKTKLGTLPINILKAHLKD
ncbi:hypothetical protein BKI52_15685 [marine bacterium AO1-C]|nr:hypothetical protein BKI52_15685 [marine bacterium AO1-C]